MNIPYALRSKFTGLCQEGITAQREALNTGQVITFTLKPGGYSGKITVTVDAGNPTHFETDWSGGDPTQFPARIKAAATALRNCGSTGRFEISHADGVLSISKTRL